MEKFELNWNLTNSEHGRYHAIDFSRNEVYQYRTLTEVNLLEVEEKILSHSPDREAIEIRFILKDQSVICFQDANDHFTCCKGNVYLPVYDVQQAIDNDYSLYEDKDLIGFIVN